METLTWLVVSQPIPSKQLNQLGQHSGAREITYANMFAPKQNISVCEVNTDLDCATLVILVVVWWCVVLRSAHLPTYINPISPCPNTKLQHVSFYGKLVLSHVDTKNWVLLSALNSQD